MRGLIKCLFRTTIATSTKLWRPCNSYENDIEFYMVDVPGPMPGYGCSRVAGCSARVEAPAPGTMTSSGGVKLSRLSG